MIIFLKKRPLHCKLVIIVDIKIIEDKKNKIMFEVNATHTLCNLLKDEIYKDGKVKIASYSIEHPLIGKPKMIVETSGDDARNVVLEAVQRLKKQYERIEKELAKELK